MQTYLIQGRKLLRKTEHILGKEDQVSVKLKKIMDAFEANVTELDAIIEGGREMEDFTAG